MASVLIISDHGEGLNLAFRLAQEKHLVKCFIQSKEPLLQGSLNPSQIPQVAMLEQYDIILCTGAGVGPLCSGVKEVRPVVSGGQLNDTISQDEVFQRKLAERFMPLVKGPAEPISEGLFLETEGWFNGEDFSFFLHRIIDDRLLDRNIGPKTPFMGSVQWVTLENEIIKRSLLPLVPFLQRGKLLGPLSIKLWVTKHDVFFVDLSAHLAYDSIQGLLELHPKGLFDLMLRLMNKDTITLKDDYTISVRLSLPPYPHVGQSETVSIAYPKEAERHIFIQPRSQDNILGCVTARAPNIRECRRRVYRTISNIVQDPSIQYRHDIGEQVEEQVGQLKMWGWLDV